MLYKRLEIARAQQPWLERFPSSEGEPIQIDDVGNDLGRDTELREHARRNFDGTTLRSARHKTNRAMRIAEVIRGFAAAIVDDHWLAEHSRDDDGRNRSQQK